VTRAGRILEFSVAVLAVAGVAPAVWAQPVDWPDIEGRIQYAYYTDDARALNGVLNSLKPRPVEGEEAAPEEDLAIRSYFRALAHYRLAQVLSTGKKSQARSEADDCGDEVDRAVAALPKVPLGLDETPAASHQRAEAYALGTACAIAVGNRIGSRIDEAVKLEPKNPRVRLVEALAAHERAGKDAAAKAAAIEKLRAVTAMFEAARAGASSTPEWGAAEAYAFLGRALFDQRDVVGAREALERALLIAPDYASARRLMSQITR
jgi:tetratricopeptide (TPR) repeat protein